MSTVYLVPQLDVLPVIGFAVTTLEQHDDVSEVTAFPVEDGSTITDDLIDQPRELIFEIVETNTPVEQTWFGEGARLATDVRSGPNIWTVGDFQIPAGKDLVREMWDRLRMAKHTRAIYTVETSLESYPNMVISGLSLPRAEKSIGWGKIKITMRQIQIVTTATVAAPKPKEPRGTAAVNKGKTTKVGETSLKEEAQRVKGELKSIGAKAIDGDYNQAFSSAISTVLGG